MKLLTSFLNRVTRLFVFVVGFYAAFCLTTFGQNVTNLWIGRPLYIGMPMTITPSAGGAALVTFYKAWATNAVMGQVQTMDGVDCGSSTNTVLVVAMGWLDTGGTNAAITNVTWGASSLTRFTNDTVANYPHADVWYLTAPTASTTNTVTINLDRLWAIGGGFALSAVVFSGANQTSPLSGWKFSHASASTNNLTVTSTDTSTVMNVLFWNTTATFTNGANQTLRASANRDSPNFVLNLRASTKPGASSVDMAFNLSASVALVHVAFSVDPP